MKTPFQLILASQNLSDVLTAIADLQSESSQFAAPKLSSENQEIAANWLSRQLQSVGVKSTLYIGGIFFVADLLGEPQARKNFVKRLLDESGISRGHAYRCVRIFVSFNGVFQRDSQISKQFGSESLRVLSEKATSQEARSEAIRLARSGTRISTKLAEELRDKYSKHAESAIEQLNPPNIGAKGNGTVISASIPMEPTSQVITGESETKFSPPNGCVDEGVSRDHSDAAIIFEGFGFKLIVNTDMKADTESELAKIVRDLEAFLSQLRSQCGNDHEQPLKIDQSSDEVSNNV